MNRTVRVVFAVVLVLGLALLGIEIGWAQGGDHAGTADTPRGWQSSQQCKECHQDVWDEWHGSHHQIAYLNPDVRLLSDDFRNKECQACHLPRPVSITGYGQRTLPRMTLPDEGVSCLTCHLGKAGEILGRREIKTAPCRPQQSAELVSVEMCASCHNQHGTTDQWRATRYPQEGKDCNSCHMPEVERQLQAGRKRKGYGHVFHGAHDKAILQSAGTFEAVAADGELVMSYENTSAGHNVPTEARHRALDIVFRFQLADGSQSEWQRAYRFRQPYRDEPGENTQLPADQKKVVRVPVPEDATKAEARLWYRLTPFVLDDDPKSTLLFEREVSLR
ncbi:MAG: multiheme c-type cytochrome [Planctomycetota bacterium]|jgi:hypothetical protein